MTSAPVALTLIVTECFKCFEQLVMQHANLDPLQFPYKTSWSTKDAISVKLQLKLSHLERKNTYAWILFIDFSSAFNMIIPQQRWKSWDCGRSTQAPVTGSSTSWCSSGRRWYQEPSQWHYLHLVLSCVFDNPIISGRHRCKQGLKHFKLIHFRPLPEVAENAFDRIAFTV